MPRKSTSLAPAAVEPKPVRKPRASKRPAEPVLAPAGRTPRTRVQKMAAVSKVPGATALAVIAAEAKVPVSDHTLYWAARKGHELALRIVANMSRDEREAICPPGLRGNIRETFLTTGATLKAQLAAAREAIAAREAAVEQRAARKARRTRKSTTVPVVVENPTEVVAMTKPTRTRKPAVAAAPARKATTDGLSAADVARANDLDARKFRAYLRSQNIARTFTSKASADKAVKAFRAASK